MNEAWLALIGAVVGGSGLKFIEHWLNRSKTADDTATQFRNELREEVKRVKEDLRTTEAELDELRAKYFTLLEDYSRVKIDRDAALLKIQEVADSTKGMTPEKQVVQTARDVAAQRLRDDE